MNKAIVFVHGYMETGHCWREWVAYFEARGYTCYAPTWVNHEVGVADERKAQTDFQDVVNGYLTLIEELPEPPILIGHSLGGIVV